MFLDIISKIFIFVAIHALKYFDFRFINFQARKLPLL